MPPRDNVTVVGTLADHRLRDFLTRVDQPYEWIDEVTGRDLLARHGVADAQLPVVVIGDEVVLVAPTLEELADALGIRFPPKARDYDVVIVGGGPAGLAAAVYAASDGLSVVVPEREAPGGQAAYTSRIENYFGIDPLGPPMSGARLARIGGRQAELFGAELLILRGAVASRPLDDGRHEVMLSTGEHLRGRALICASGVEWRRLDVPGIDAFFGRGVYFGTGRSEAPLLEGKKVVVVGAGNSAGQAALDLAEHAERVTMLCRGPSLAASLSGYLLDRIRANDRIDIRMQSRVTAVSGDGKLEEVTINGTEHVPTDAMFIAIGGVPQTDWAKGHALRRDEAGYLFTGPDLLENGRPPAEWPLKRAPYALEASVPGVFVAGDVRHGSTKRVAAAVGEGATAVALVHPYLAAPSTPGKEGPLKLNENASCPSRFDVGAGPSKCAADAIPSPDPRRRGRAVRNRAADRRRDPQDRRRLRRRRAQNRELPALDPGGPLMSFLLSCPNCGPRDVNEFACAGEVTRRPKSAPADFRELTAYIYLRDNVAGIQREWWYHRHGCEIWFLAERDTRTNEVLNTELPQPSRGDEGVAAPREAAVPDTPAT